MRGAAGGRMVKAALEVPWGSPPALAWTRTSPRRVLRFTGTVQVNRAVFAWLLAMVVGKEAPPSLDSRMSTLPVKLKFVQVMVMLPPPVNVPLLGATPLIVAVLGT